MYKVYGYNCKDERRFTHYDALTEDEIYIDNVKDVKKYVKKLNGEYNNTFLLFDYEKIKP